MKNSFPKFNIRDVVNTTLGAPFPIMEVVCSASGTFFYREGPHMRYMSEDLLHLVKPYAPKYEVGEVELENEAEFDTQKYLSRLDKNLHTDEVVAYFGISRILDEIGVDDCIDHFGEDKILQEIGQPACEKCFRSARGESK